MAEQKKKTTKTRARFLLEKKKHQDYSGLFVSLQDARRHGKSMTNYLSFREGYGFAYAAIAQVLIEDVLLNAYRHVQSTDNITIDPETLEAVLHKSLIHYIVPKEELLATRVRTRRGTKRERDDEVERKKESHRNGQNQINQESEVFKLTKNMLKAKLTVDEVAEACMEQAEKFKGEKKALIMEQCTAAIESYNNGKASAAAKRKAKGKKKSGGAAKKRKKDDGNKENDPKQKNSKNKKPVSKNKSKKPVSKKNSKKKSSSKKPVGGGKGKGKRTPVPRKKKASEPD